MGVYGFALLPAPANGRYFTRRFRSTTLSAHASSDFGIVKPGALADHIPSRSKRVICSIEMSPVTDTASACRTGACCVADIATSVRARTILGMSATTRTLGNLRALVSPLELQRGDKRYLALEIVWNTSPIAAAIRQGIRPPHVDFPASVA